MADQTFTSGQILTAAQMTALQTNIGLTYITSTTATSGTSLSINNCFSSAFRNYRIVISNLTTTGVAASSLRLRVGGVDSSASYYYNGQYMSFTSTTINGTNGSNVGAWDSNIVTDATMSGGVIDLLNPFVAFVTSMSVVGFDPRTGGGGGRTLSGIHYANTSYDGFSFISGSTITNITATVYGYR